MNRKKIAGGKQTERIISISIGAVKQQTDKRKVSGRIKAEKLRRREQTEKKHSTINRDLELRYCTNVFMHNCLPHTLQRGVIQKKYMFILIHWFG